MHSLVERLLRLGDPVYWAYRIRAKVDVAGLFAHYRCLALGAGFNQLYFVLSFDCDTKEDAEVAWGVHERLMEMGVMAAYAVPGELLKKGVGIYRRIQETGAEFINHGYCEHTYFNTARGAYASCFFYDQQSRDTVSEDIILGDQNLRETMGVVPKGFRAPHFGTFQKPEQLRFQHGVLKELGYDFSTSTVPLYAYRYGPAFREFGMLELPVSGMHSQPLRILDTWTCFQAPERRFSPLDYVGEGRLVGSRLKTLGIGLLNFYADPSHIHDRPEFFDTVAFWASVAKPVTYSQLLEEIA